MIRPGIPIREGQVARHYDELDPFYRSIWGENLHHGLWRTGMETPDQAIRNLTEEVAVRARIEPGSRVCDVGCGYGGTARHLTERFGCSVVGITLSAAQYRLACRTSGAVNDPRFLLADWLEVSLAPASFDAVIAVESFSHMEDKADGIRRAREVLRPGGHLVLAVWMAAPRPGGWQRRQLLEPICDEGRLPGIATEAEYRRWIRDAGMELLEIDDLSRRVRRTWSVCLRRMTALLVRDRAAWRYLRDSRNSERRFAWTVARMWLAYATGALRYALITSRAP